VCDFFQGDFNTEDLKAELATLYQLYRSTKQTESPSVETIDQGCFIGLIYCPTITPKVCM
jgi:hypothetical protein